MQLIQLSLCKPSTSDKEGPHHFLILFSQHSRSSDIQIYNPDTMSFQRFNLLVISLGSACSTGG